MKSFRGTFIFTIIVIAACLISYFEVFKKGNDEAEKKEKDSQLYQLMADEISQIDLTNGENFMSLRKTEGNWALEKPIIDKADQAAVKSFIDMIVGQKTSDLVDESEKLDFKTYGLDQPAFRLKLAGTKKGALSLTLEDVSYGSVRAYDGSNYSRFGDQKKVYLAPAYLSAALNKKASDFRNKNMFTTSIADVDRIEISGAQKLELERGKEDWKMLVPSDFGTPASSSSVQSFLDLVRNVKGTEIVADNKDQLVKFHLDRPGVTLRLHRSQEPKDFELKISITKNDKDQNVYMMSSDSTGILKGVPSNFETINKVAFDFTDKHRPFAFGTADVGSIEISSSMLTANLKKNANSWENADPKDKRTVDTLKVEEFLGKFNHLEAKETLKVKAPILKNQIIVNDSSGKLLFKMNWGEPIEDENASPMLKKVSRNVFVRTNKIKDPIVLPFTQIEGLAMKTLFKNLDPVQFSGSPPPVKKSQGASLDQHLPPESK